jgi:hypothetical protein
VNLSTTTTTKKVLVGHSTLLFSKRRLHNPRQVIEMIARKSRLVAESNFMNKKKRERQTFLLYGIKNV